MEFAKVVYSNELSDDLSIVLSGAIDPASLFQESHQAGIVD